MLYTTRPRDCSVPYKKFYELMKKWGEYYVEDDVYHFVNYGL